MNKHDRELQRDADSLMRLHGVTEYRLEKSKKHRLLVFRYRDKWNRVTLSSTPRTDCAMNFMRQYVTRIIHGVDRELQHRSV